MASLQSKADAVKAAVSSTSTCTSATTVILKELLTSELEISSTMPLKSIRATKPTTISKAKLKAPGRAGASISGSGKEELAAKEKAVLATHIINAALKSLGEASKPPPPTPCKRQTSEVELRKRDSRNGLRRSNSAPLSPLQARSLNRVATSPTVPAKTARLSSIQAPSVGCLSTVECARVAFTCLKSLASSGAVTLPKLQLEAGMSAFIHRLLSLGLHGQALKELVILKQWLGLAAEESSGARGPKISKDEGRLAAKSVSKLLDFKGPHWKGPLLSLVITTQLQILRLISISKKPDQVEAAIPFLDEACKWSPLSLLLQSVREGSQNSSKVARQLDSLSQLVLSLTPSVSSKDDIVAAESRLSPSPQSSLTLQSLGLQTKLHWWRLADHRGDINKDILSPLSRCLTAFIRRSKSTPSEKYQLAADVFEKVQSVTASFGLKPATTSKSPLALIYQVLGSAAQESRRYDLAAGWIRQVKRTLHPEDDSAARHCSVASQLLAILLKSTASDEDVKSLLQEITDGLQGSLRGDTTELEELMVNLSIARRAAVTILAGKVDDSDSIDTVPQTAKDDLRSFILQCPRFSLRWLGKPPSRDASTKDTIRYEQRRQLLMRNIQALLDSALMVVKGLIDEDKVEWVRLDAVLQDCLTLLEYLGDLNVSAPKNDLSNSYHVKISHLYWRYYTVFHKRIDAVKNSMTLLALRRSIDTVRDKSAIEKEKAQLVFKLECFANISKEHGKPDTAREALQSICTAMVEEGVLATVASSLAEQPPSLAWSLTEKAQLLSRTLCLIAKLDHSWKDWTFFLPEAERAAVLEHLLHIIIPGDERHTPVDSLADPSVESLLRIYTPEKFPVRRTRTLIHLLALNIDNVKQRATIRSQTEAALRTGQVGSCTEDTQLLRYMPHLQAYLTSICRLLDSPSEGLAAYFQEPLSVWQTIANSSQTDQDIYKSIDNPSGLVAHLTSVAQFARMKGDHALQHSVLELSATISKFFTASDPDSMVLTHSLLATEYGVLGYLSEALETLEKTRDFIQNHDKIGREALVAFHLSRAECLIYAGSTAEA
jgi:separase